MNRLLKIFAACLIAGSFVAAPAPAQAAAAGDTFVYRVINAYNREVIGHLRHTVAPATTAQGEVVSVAADNPALGLARTEIYAPRGHWLRRTLESHGVPVEYEFASALPAVQPQLAAGQTWSARVPAKVPDESKTRSVRVDGRVLGMERIRVPAGEFDAVKIDRTIYAGDVDYFISETRIVEFDWYAPALGRSVRTETRSDWRDTRSGCRRPEHCIVRGSWLIVELAEAPARAAP